MCMVFICCSWEQLITYKWCMVWPLFKLLQGFQKNCHQTFTKLDQTLTKISPNFTNLHQTFTKIWPNFDQTFTKLSPNFHQTFTKLSLNFTKPSPNFHQTWPNFPQTFTNLSPTFHQTFSKLSLNLHKTFTQLWPICFAFFDFLHFSEMPFTNQQFNKYLDEKVKDGNFDEPN